MPKAMRFVFLIVIMAFYLLSCAEDPSIVFLPPGGDQTDGDMESENEDTISEEFACTEYVDQLSTYTVSGFIVYPDFVPIQQDKPELQIMIVHGKWSCNEDNSIRMEWPGGPDMERIDMTEPSEFYFEQVISQRLTPDGTPNSLQVWAWQINEQEIPNNPSNPEYCLASGSATLEVPENGGELSDIIVELSTKVDNDKCIPSPPEYWQAKYAE